MEGEDLEKLPWDPSQGASPRGPWPGGPRFFRYALFVREPADGFLALDGFRKGFVCVNGFNLGRYWEIGPQRSLYIPAPLLRQGRNEVLVFDIDHAGPPANSAESAATSSAPAPRVVSEAIWNSGALPRGAKEAVADAVSGLGAALRSFSGSGD
mmetsp:Transcript_31529/g.79946  ORF Transcript_31529/g.79946 Transcript_31529/m.79946 type:complete len:154 (-) Transcript_31529:80-541(-)